MSQNRTLLITRALMLTKQTCHGRDSNISQALQLYQVITSLIIFLQMNDLLLVSRLQFLIISL